ncbi:hypothetical protein AVEN_161896-1 [Araneus ventricosus]|uniref:Uncharacterized protein n=1 Tax=Araneus ventricosus TaxID=182803 RepID=A0A4Y2J5Q6_ARAVE|nr:hypothetical protein AVEN_270900-1 [Araneus ventricosus]GBM85573.1 hypothetical protein AVEN_161896-1 [Araneus ventricosus]
MQAVWSRGGPIGASIIIIKGLQKIKITSPVTKTMMHPSNESNGTFEYSGSLQLHLLRDGIRGRSYPWQHSLDEELTSPWAIKILETRQAASHANRKDI